jgi:hypothetical protein
MALRSSQRGIRSQGDAGILYECGDPVRIPLEKAHGAFGHGN